MSLLLQQPVTEEIIRNSTYEDQRFLMGFLLLLLLLVFLALAYLELWAPMIRSSLSEHRNPIDYPKIKTVMV